MKGTFGKKNILASHLVEIDTDPDLEHWKKVLQLQFTLLHLSTTSFYISTFLFLSFHQIIMCLPYIFALFSCTNITWQLFPSCAPFSIQFFSLIFISLCSFVSPFSTLPIFISSCLFPPFSSCHSSITPVSSGLSTIRLHHSFFSPSPPSYTSTRSHGTRISIEYRTIFLSLNWTTPQPTAG